MYSNNPARLRRTAQFFSASANHRPPDRRVLAAAGASQEPPFQRLPLKRTTPHPRRITRGAGGAERPSGTLHLRKVERRGDRIAGPQTLPVSARARFPSTWRGWTGDGGSMAGGRGGGDKVSGWGERNQGVGGDWGKEIGGAGGRCIPRYSRGARDLRNQRTETLFGVKAGTDWRGFSAGMAA